MIRRSRFPIGRLALSGAVAVLLLAATRPVHSQALTEEPATIRLEPVTVLGSQEAVLEVPGSGAYIDEEVIHSQNYQNSNEILRRVPGVYIREEDGYGLFPNISLRGVDGARTAKVTIMEDGILTAPAPYSAPAAYYSPNAGRMHAIEVLKGSSSIKYGPHTTGGVINYLSTPIPEGKTEMVELPYSGKEALGKDFVPPTEERNVFPGLTTYLRTTYGSNNDFIAHGYTGSTYDTEMGRVGFLLEGYYRQADGFRDILSSDGYRGSNDTGFSLFEPILKLSWEPNSEVYQRFEFKIAYSQLDSNESYVGLSEKDFRKDPYTRYPATRFDNIGTENMRTHLRHIIEPTDRFTLTTTVYYQTFDRNWFKLNDIVVDGQVYNPAVALATGGDPLAVLKGEAAGELRVRNNNRHYYLGGVETVGNVRFTTGPVDHSLDLGIRFHTDQIRRNQRDEIFLQNDGGGIVDSTLTPGGSAGNRREKSQSWAIFALDEARIGPLTLKPGIRYEHIDYEYTEYGVGDRQNTAIGSGSSAMDAFAPGIGATYDFNPKLSVFAGVHKGFSTPGPRANARNNLKEETSIGYELGSRYYAPESGFGTELVLFYTDFDNLIVIDNIGGAGSGVTENVGDVTSYGAEYVLAYDPGVQNQWAFRMPNRLAFTYTHARLDGPSQSIDPESIFSGGKDGARLPYIPDYQIHFTTGIEFDRYGIVADFTYVPETFSTASNTDKQVSPDGTPDARFGKTDSYFLVDVTVHYQPTEWAKLVAGVKNLAGDEYIVSRHPLGPRSGAPRTWYAGVELTF